MKKTREDIERLKQKLLVHANEERIETSEESDIAPQKKKKKKKPAR
jgi:hypothetical protein